jgi:hypothetical protein
VLEHAKGASIGSGGTVRKSLRRVFEARARANLLEQIIGLGFCCGESCVVGSLSGSFIDWGLSCG